MDPPIAPEAVSARTGIPLVRTVQADNRYVCETVDQIHRGASFRTGYTEDQPIPAYSPVQNEQSPPVGITVNDLANGQSTANPFLLAELENVHRLQQAHLQNAENRRSKGKGKGWRKGKDTDGPAVPTYEGNDGQCNICQHMFNQGEWVVRLACNHLFHSDCWDENLCRREAECECPNCRGPPIPKAHFRHMGNPSRRVARQAIRRLRGSNTASSSSFTDATSDVQRPQFLPTPTTATILVTAEQLAEWSMSWSPLSPDEYFRQKHAKGERGNTPPDNQQEEVHVKTISKTKIPGRKSLLVDLGSKINAIGKETEKEFTAAGNENGYETTYVPRTNRPYVNGVGAGAANCDYEAITPIAVKFAEHPATKESFQANITEGVGENLPAILGLDSMQEKDSVIILRKGRKSWRFLGLEDTKLNGRLAPSCCPWKRHPQAIW